MAERATAEAQLARILNVLPRAARKGGASLTELAAALDADPGVLVRDLEEVYTRAYYHPAGSVDDVNIAIESDRVAVWTTGEFRRPLRLNAGEALALALGLRVLAADAPPVERGWRIEMAARLEEGVASEPLDDLAARVAVTSGSGSADGIRAVITEAARSRKRCRIEYLKPGAAGPDTREIDPYVVLLADGRWYVVGRCHGSGEPRVFRLDRMTCAIPLDERFEVPAEFDPESYIDAGRVYRGGQDVEVEVRYSPRIARWIEEQGPVTRLEDGSVLVRYRVGDPTWLVKHVLQYASDAEVVGPLEMRRYVQEALDRVLGVGESPPAAGVDDVPHG